MTGSTELLVSFTQKGYLCLRFRDLEGWKYSNVDVESPMSALWGVTSQRHSNPPWPGSRPIAAVPEAVQAQYGVAVAASENAPGAHHNPTTIVPSHAFPRCHSPLHPQIQLQYPFMHVFNSAAGQHRPPLLPSSAVSPVPRFHCSGTQTSLAERPTLRPDSRYKAGMSRSGAALNNPPYSDASKSSLCRGEDGRRGQLGGGVGGRRGWV
ncbi:hypothetical protein EDC01DRAFT_749203 [Geopyxis carbonaria]|nr:hypothetical protein EDC01DRAFT_749203 [Geopyxis carbonaria]